MTATILSLTALNVRATDQCGSEMTPEDFLRWMARHEAGVHDLSNELRQALPWPVYVPVAMHIVQNDDGVGGATESQLIAALHIVNRSYARAGIVFCNHGALPPINNSALFEVDSLEEFNQLCMIDVVPNVVNIWFVNNLYVDRDLCGRSSFPSDSIQGIVIENSCIGGPTQPKNVFAHELGHYFDLLHTHDASHGIECPRRFVVPPFGLSCENDGDLLCDTPADPGLNAMNINENCQYTGPTNPPWICNGPWGEPPYTPDPRNIMSYAPDRCRTRFTQGQGDRMRATIMNARPELINTDCPGCSTGPWWPRYAATSAPSARGDVGGAYDTARNVFIIFGGFDGSLLNDTWEWSSASSAWSRRAVVNTPPHLDTPAMVYDASRQVTLLIGKQLGGTALQTWLWNGTNWTQSDGAQPTQRSGHAIAYDSHRQRVILFGGFGESGLLQDVWEWDGINWTTRVTTNPPTARFHHSMAYDKARKRMVLFGGIALNYTDDTWELNTSSGQWSQRLPVTRPAPRANHRMIYDENRARILLFGGNSDPTTYGDTWEWNSVDWQSCCAQAQLGPSRRTEFAFAYDSVQQRAVCWGGYVDNANQRLDDMWELLDRPPVIRNLPPTRAMEFGLTAIFDGTAGGNGPFGYQWTKNDQLLVDDDRITGSTQAVLRIRDVRASDSGVYKVTANDSCGVATATVQFIANNARVAPVVP